MNPLDVVDTPDSEALPKEGELCLSILAKLGALTDDFCLAQELVDPTATPSVVLPSLTAEVLAKLRTSTTFHSGGAAPRSCFHSAPTLALATSKSWEV